MQEHRDSLRPAEVFVLRPDVSYLHRLARHSQWRQPGWGKKFLQPVSEAAKIGAPLHCEPACPGPHGYAGGRLEKLPEILPESGAIACPRERRSGLCRADLRRSLGQKIPQIGPEIVGDKMRRRSKPRHPVIRKRTYGSRARARHSRSCRIGWERFVKISWHVLHLFRRKFPRLGVSSRIDSTGRAKVAPFDSADTGRSSL